jgi:cytochrome c553
MTLAQALAVVSCGGGQLTTSKQAENNSPSAQPAPPSSEPQSEAPNPAPTTNLTYFNFVETLMARECTSCHGVPATAGSPATFRLDTYDDVDGMRGLKSLAERVRVRMEARTMPPSGTGLVTDDEIRKIAEWVAAGAPVGTQAPPVLEPSVTFLQPPLNGTVANQSATLEVRFSETSERATWAAFYSTTPGATSGGTPIATALATSQTTLTWNTAGIAPDDYTVYVVLSDPLRTVSAAANGIVTVSHPQEGNTSPELRVIGPNGGDLVIKGNELNVSWMASDSDPGDLATMSYTVDYSGDDGTTWKNIGNATGVTSWAWAVPVSEPLTLLARIRVRASDGKGGVALDQSDTPFEVGEAGLNNPTYADFDAVAVKTCSGGGCHSSGQRDYTNAEANVRRDKDLIIDRISRVPGSTGYMPKGGTLTNAEEQTMLNYLNSL